MAVSTETISDRGRRAFKEKHGHLFPHLIALTIIYEIALVAGIVWVLVTYGPGEDGLYVNIAAMLFSLPFLVYVGWLSVYLARARSEFWKGFATAHGWTYTAKGDLVKEVPAIMFRRTNKLFSNMTSLSTSNIVSGQSDGRPVRIFEYAFTIGRGKRSEVHVYTVFEFTFSGTFPHLYLNRKGDGYDLDPGTPLKLPEEFEKSFELFAPAQYEIEALEIFTPDILSYLIDVKWPFDIELVDQRLIIFRKMHLSSMMQLESEWHRAKTLASKLAPLLDRVSYEEVGTHKSTLS